MPGQSPVNWPAVRARYVAADDLTHDQLAEEFGITIAQISRRSAPGKWSLARVARQEEDARKTLDKIRKMTVEAEVTRTADQLQALRAAQKALRSQIDSGNLKANSLDAAVNALVNAIKGERLVSGEVTERTEQDVNLKGSLGHSFTDKSTEELEALAGVDGDAAEGAGGTGAA